MIGSCCSSWLPAAAATMTVASLPQHVDFALLSQHVASFWVLQQLAVSVVGGIVSLGLSELGKRNSAVVI